MARLRIKYKAASCIYNQIKIQHEDGGRRGQERGKDRGDGESIINTY